MRHCVRASGKHIAYGIDIEALKKGYSSLFFNS